jgi:hypothetical protein
MREGARRAAAVIVDLISGRAALVPQGYQQCRRTRNLAESFAAQRRRVGFTRARASVIPRPDAQSEANRGAAAPQPKEWS